MCHVGGPLGYGPYAGKGDEALALWKPRITELAKCQNGCAPEGPVLQCLLNFYTSCARAGSVDIRCVAKAGAPSRAGRQPDREDQKL
jgi:hypothetical protein